jgi:hypothetical protein
MCVCACIFALLLDVFKYDVVMQTSLSMILDPDFECWLDEVVPNGLDAIEPYKWDYHRTYDRHYERPLDIPKVLPRFHNGTYEERTNQLIAFILSLRGAEDTTIRNDLGELLSVNDCSFDWNNLDTFFRELHAHLERAQDPVWTPFCKEVLEVLGDLAVTGLPEAYDGDDCWVF